MSSITVYGEIEDEIKSIFRSRLQTQIILTLMEENKNLSQLREITGSTSQAVIPKIRRYKKDGILFDLTEQIFGFDNKSLGWGKRFFQYYKDRSKIVEMPKN